MFKLSSFYLLMLIQNAYLIIDRLLKSVNNKLKSGWNHSPMVVGQGSSEWVKRGDYKHAKNATNFIVL